MPQAGGEMPEELQAGRVGPMQVFEQEEGRTGISERNEKCADFGKERGLIGHTLQSTLAKAAGGGGRSWSKAQASNRSSHGPYGGVFVRS